jgi:prepilin-type N-terminal cleavage/methylation domain-containing protein
MVPIKRRAAKGIIVTLRAGKDNHAFTLLELILVLGLLGLSAAAVLPSISRGLKNREARQAALHFAAAARELGSRARSAGVPQGLLVDTRRNSYQSAREAEVALPPSVFFALVEGGEALENGLRRFSFYPNGASFGGRVVISAGGYGVQYAVRFHPLSGRVEVLSGARG